MTSSPLHQIEQTTPAEIHSPIVTCDISLKDMVTYIDVNSVFFGHIISKGIEVDAPEKDLYLHLSADHVEKVAGDISGYANYNRETNTITVFMGSIKYIIDKVLAAEYEEHGEIRYKSYDAAANMRATEKTLHEVKHYIEDTVIGRNALHDEIIDYLEEVIPYEDYLVDWLRSGDEDKVEAAKNLRRLFLSQIANNMKHDDYLHSPREERANKFAREIAELCLVLGAYPFDIRFKWNKNPSVQTSGAYAT